MSVETYNSILYLIAAAVMLAIAVLVFSFGFMLLRWKTPKRRGHVLRFLSSIVAILGLFMLQYVVQYWIFMPSLIRRKTAEMEAIKAEQFAKASVVHVGDTAPEFSLPMTDGKEFSLSATHGDVVLINFFATWCGPCRLELPHMQQIWEKRKATPHFRMLVIGRDETTESVIQFCKEQGLTFPAAADPEQAVYSKYAHTLIPRTLVISPEGKIIFYTAGFYEDDLKQLDVILDQQLTKLNSPQMAESR